MGDLLSESGSYRRNFAQLRAIVKIGSPRDHTGSDVETLEILTDWSHICFLGAGARRGYGYVPQGRSRSDGSSEIIHELVVSTCRQSGPECTLCAQVFLALTLSSAIHTVLLLRSLHWYPCVESISNPVVTDLAAEMRMNPPPTAAQCPYASWNWWLSREWREVLWSECASFLKAGEKRSYTKLCVLLTPGIAKFRVTGGVTPNANFQVQQKVVGKSILY
ncbi:hypothetical protein B0H13DRAFT_2289092 [Mycena leptocephala]|nr:hypothetical protein B0H13DRAFT_2289092 [Mycena leptocephala]